ncbi:EAL domain-containing protein [Marinicella litoralis]|uniref:EAL domain-containing protein (Putative c-di-GMP-specific phosphodiesterase class I) n=1 Tax=Marinicella litoralis TaxID=644220 RepID=A0A4R6Y2T6_9GAMM|nr:GGDEF domain-containing protein [Marinicella litoralis]TDR23318.1 EAL domain-containing protein (putative c-di-GMP-specific phosphodiesterase class I) [Marinicella litoralis]
MEKKKRSLLMVIFTFVVILLVAAGNIYSLSRSHYLAQLDGQLSLLANHKAISHLLNAVDTDEIASQTSQFELFLKQQHPNAFGVLFYHELPSEGEAFNWASSQKTPINGMAFDNNLVSELAAKAIDDNQSATSVMVGDKTYRTLFVPASTGQRANLLLLVEVSGVRLLYAKYAFWLIPVIVALAGIVYCWHRWIHTKRLARWLKLIDQSMVDPITGLPNQQQLLLDLENSRHTNLAFIKVSNFNSILNTYGPIITNGVLRQISAVIAGFKHPMLLKPTCYHVNQSVFAILEDQDISFDGIAEVTKSLIRTIMSTEYQVGNGQTIAVNVTTGAVRQNTDAFILANMALQEAESNKLQFYLVDERDSMLPETYKRDLALTQVLIKGINERRLIAYYQPIFSAKDHSKVEKYECLARLVDGQGEILLMPNVFISLAQRANIYYLITKVMIKHAVEFAQKNKVMVTINLSIADINNPRTCDYLFEKITKSGVGDLLQFELLENEAIVETELVIEFIKLLHHHGCKVGMDDLGKGHSNIERLLNLPVDFVKIDRAIMENVTQNPEIQNLARGIVELAHKKGFKVVAEYCADQDLVEAAIDLGVDYLQGFYLGRPAPDLFVHNEQQMTASGRA